MKRITCGLGLLGLLAGAALIRSVPAAEKGQVPDIKQVMDKLNKGPNALTGALGRELKEDEPDWGTVQKGAKEFAEFAGHLAKNKPPLGGQESWARLTRSYVDNAIGLQVAAERKDKEAASAAHAKLRSSCMACHREHRPKE